jgi:hypothetical protein
MLDVQSKTIAWLTFALFRAATFFAAAESTAVPEEFFVTLDVVTLLMQLARPLLACVKSMKYF